MTVKTLDVICLGRLAVDFYSQQIGSPLEAISSAAMYLGGSSGNVAYGTARLGLKSAMLTRLGNEQMGRFLIDELAAVGCDTSQIQLDDDRLTGLVILGIADKDTFPLLFCRENVADMAIDASLIKEEVIASARALAITGTHLSTPQSAATCRVAIEYARKNGTKVCLDIDYRPVLWGLTGKGEGENRYVADRQVTDLLQSFVPLLDLIVGTEEEIHIAGGSDDTIECLKRLRAITAAEIVVKRGPYGASCFASDIPDTLDEGVTVKGVRVEVLNVLGAGDAFMSGFLRGWIGGEGLETSLRYANACGALVVSRHGCAPSMPTAEELDHYIAHADQILRPDEDDYLNYLHRVTTRRNDWHDLCVLAFDHRWQFQEMAGQAVGDDRDVPYLKTLILKGAIEGARRCGLDPAGALQPGILCDDIYGQDTLNAITGSGWWIGRPVELPRSLPLEFEYGNNVGQHLTTWPREQVVKCLVFYHPDDPVELRLQQERKVKDLYDACCFSGHELLLEVIPPSDSEVDDTTMPRIMTRFYHLAVYPDWWKLPSQPASYWPAIDRVIDRYAPHCRGIVILGLDQPIAQLAQGFREAGQSKWVKGFAIGRTIFAEPCRQWLAGDLSDEKMIEHIADRYQEMVGIWQQRHQELS
ncbi:MAG: 5-dehydro-2-deoxygluconokinase [Desulfopila sp.]